MGVFPRGQKLYFKIKDESGQWVQRPSIYKVGQEKEALKACDELQKIIDKEVARAKANGPHLGPHTVRSYSRKWIGQKIDQGVKSARQIESRSATMSCRASAGSS